MESAESWFSPEEVERARAYHRPLYRAWATSTVIGLGYLAVLSFTAAGDRLASPLDGLPLWPRGLLYPALVLGLGALLRLPISYWRGYVHEHRWGFSTQRILGWFGDWAKAVGLSVAITSLALLVLVELAARLPDSWQWFAAAGAALLVVVLSLLGPVVFEPLFNRFHPLDDAALAEEVRELGRAAGAPVDRVLVADASRRTKKENAYVSGIGRTRRVVVYDTLLARGEPQEVKLVVAHELCHRRARHTAKGTALGALGAALAVALLAAALGSAWVLQAIHAGSPADPLIAPFALLLFGALELVSLPVGAAVSRRWERVADRASVELTGDGDGFARMTRNLAISNLSELDPTRLAYLLFTHPSPPERIAAALAGDAGPGGSQR